MTRRLPSLRSSAFGLAVAFFLVTLLITFVSAPSAFAVKPTADLKHGDHSGGYRSAEPPVIGDDDQPTIRPKNPGGRSFQAVNESDDFGGGGGDDDTLPLTLLDDTVSKVKLALEKMGRVARSVFQLLP